MRLIQSYIPIQNTVFQRSYHNYHGIMRMFNRRWNVVSPVCLTTQLANSSAPGLCGECELIQHGLRVLPHVNPFHREVAAICAPLRCRDYRWGHAAGAGAWPFSALAGDVYGDEQPRDLEEPRTNLGRDAYNAGGCAPLYQHSSKRPGRSFGMGLAHS